MMAGAIFVCPVLNFLVRNIAKDKESVIKVGTKFFTKDALKQAIEVCKNALNYDALEKRRGTHPPSTFLSDFFELISGFVANKKELPLFVVFDPSDVPNIPNDPGTIVASRLNECVRMLNYLVENQDTSSQPTGPVVWPSVPRATAPVPVVLTNIPSDINVRNPAKQREFIEKLGCSDKVKHIVAQKNKLVVHMTDEQSAEAAVAAIPDTLQIRAKVIKTEYAGIIRMDPDYDVSQIPVLVSSVCDATRFGGSAVVQLKFRSKEDLDYAIKHGIKIEYCLFRVTLPIEKPKQCHNCQGFGHFAKDCSNPTKCRRCAGNHNIKVQACQADIKCANCGKPHRSDSLICVEMKKHLPAQGQRNNATSPGH